MRKSLGALCAGAALALSIAAVVHAQQAQPDPAPMTPAQIDAEAAQYAAGVKRLKEVLAVLDTEDYAAIRAYFEANSVRTMAPPPGTRPSSWEEAAFQNLLGRHHLSGGFDLMHVRPEPYLGQAVGIVRSRVTGDEEYLIVRVEPQAPYRITWLPAADPKVVATWGLKRVASVAVTEEERLQEIGSYLKRMGDAEIFSGAVVIARDGKPVFAQAYGYADREKNVPNTLDTPFLMGSLTKLFTGLAIGQLVEQGKLGYDDPLARFLPDFPDPESARKIRIKHLLSHTSGLGDYLGTEAYRDAMDRMVAVKARVDIFPRKPPAFEPGTKWAYSNIGYELLGRVVEIVTGQDYYDYMQKNVFAPAGATSASFPLLPKNGVAVVPMGYPYAFNYSKNALRHFDNQLGVMFRRGSAAGNAIVSALDLIKLSNAMHTGRIVQPETLRLHSSSKPELGATTYGYGFIAGPYLGRPFVGHNGRAPGQCTEFGELRDTPYTIAVLSNFDFVCRPVTERILRVLRPSEATGKPAQPKG